MAVRVSTGGAERGIDPLVAATSAIGKSVFISILIARSKRTVFFISVGEAPVSTSPDSCRINA